MKNLITEENNVAVQQILVVAKQDLAIQKAMDSINDLFHINKIEFEEYGKNYGINQELKEELYSLYNKLSKAKYGKF
jgi:1,2-phenylacetyl-CoA epoxidase catalytic subunit